MENALVHKQRERERYFRRLPSWSF